MRSAFDSGFGEIAAQTRIHFDANGTQKINVTSADGAGDVRNSQINGKHSGQGITRRDISAASASKNC